MWLGEAAQSLATDNPAHRRIVTQAFGVIHVLISSKTTEHWLTQQTDQRMATVPTGARISEPLACHRGQPECVIEFAVCQWSGIGRHHGEAKLEH
jgi:hypothetical protein